MKFVIITQVPHMHQHDGYYAYAPYVKEMNIWFKYLEKITVVAPMCKDTISPIWEDYQHNNLQFIPVAAFDVTSFKNTLKTITQLPRIAYSVYKAMTKADHIHLRCPGNMGLIGTLVQIAFPKKKKTAKYAGNWDPNSKQPWSYRLQKWILSNPFLTRNMQVLVYGEWPNQSKNIKPFFTATYNQLEILNTKPNTPNRLSVRTGSSANSPKTPAIKFLFVGTLSPGKQPLYAIQLVEQLIKKGKKAVLELYGEGVLRADLEAYIAKHQLQNQIQLKGNQNKEELKEAYQNSHFVVLPSKSEGWPKAVAEAMFWGCVPIATPVSCVPQMFDYGKRGVMLTGVITEDIEKVTRLLADEQAYNRKSIEAQSWSQQFTMDAFEQAIAQVLSS